MAIRVQNVAVDSPDPEGLARWWAQALGWRVTFADGNESVVEPPAGSPEDGVSPDLVFVTVTDPKVVKNRWHLCLRPEDQAAEVDRLLALGARRVDVGQGPDVTWVVLADPEDNEFCVLRALRPDELEA